MRKTIDVIDGTIEITIDGKTIEIPVEITIEAEEAAKRAAKERRPKKN